MERILIVNFPGGMGGTEKFVKNLFDSIDEKKYIFDILFYHGMDSYYREYFQEKGSRLYEMPYYVKHPLRFLAELLKFYKQHKEYKIVYCQANHASAMLYTFPIWFSQNRKILFHSHNSSSSHLLLHKILSYVVIKRCDKLLACSTVASEFMFGKACKNSEVINNSINLDVYKYNEAKRAGMRNKYGVNDELVLGHIGGFREQKNHMFLLEVFYELQKMKENSKLVLVGDGELKAQIIEKIKELNLTDKVIMVGNVGNAEDYYQMFDIFLLPSLFEGLPFVGIEAQASGTECMFADTIEKRVALTPLAHFCSLNQVPEVWAKELLEIHYEKKDYSELIEESGYGLRKLSGYYNSLFQKLLK